MGKIGIFDLEKHFAFYGAYHSDPINIIIHTIFVWPIAFFTLLILYFTPDLFNLPRIEISLCGYDLVLIFNIGFVLTVIYALFYVCFDPKAGSLAAFIFFLFWVASSFVGKYLGFSLAWKVVLAGQVICWTGQFIGHGMFEKRAPALLDNLSQAFLMAPLFVLLEALHTFCGYEPYPGFNARVQQMIGAEINEWQEKKQKLIN
ncbi:2-hydroxy-palmitic acid dioxygenase Mpo1-like [Dillenia turbinata]|uniref:2-hydroxy-palmitic acid dioxygenase Mpo1-like n=1 Tax=Dillenia turbinata TaxID=194707 RepID=A0AAN8VKT1_9MAGN